MEDNNRITRYELHNRITSTAALVRALTYYWLENPQDTDTALSGLMGIRDSIEICESLEEILENVTKVSDHDLIPTKRIGEGGAAR